MKKSFELTRTARFILLNARLVATMIVAFGLAAGFLLEARLGLSMLSRFGSITVAFGALAFGFVAAELLNRAQDGRFAREADDPRDPTSVSNIRSALDWQAVGIFFGTLQWGFGDLVGNKLLNCGQWQC